MDKFYYYFHSNYAIDAYKYLGCHFNEEKNEATFRVYAPNATKIYLVGDFNNWEETIPMHKIDDSIFEATASCHIYDSYKYKIYNGNRILYKQDPYSYHNETGILTCSKVYPELNYEWTDASWLEKRAKTRIYEQPFNIYEVHLGSWKKKKDGFYSYREIADKLIKYVKEMGYTHIEIMPLNEYPYEGSWGYQVTGYFSVTSRYGIPHDFMYLVDKCHENNIGIILDWVPAHFPKDAFGLCEFDGGYVYEYSEKTRMEYKTWGTRLFNHGKPEVKSFLISSAMMLFDKYHIDGLRVDAVAAMLYLDYDRDEYIPNKYGGNYNLEAIDFLKSLNIEIFKNFPNALMIAEESTDFKNVSRPVFMDGLGFSHKWNMGWMNDTLSYMKVNPFFKHYDHNKMSFSTSYAYSENFILPLSHDEVVHGKCSLLNKMPGDYDEKFMNLRAYYTYMMTHPGAKLLFMGGEIAQFIEWDYKKELDWLLLKYPRHREMQYFVKKLNKLYLKNSMLWDNDECGYGFEWINADDASGNTYSYIRKNRKGEKLVVFLNFSGNDYHNYKIGVDKGTYKVILNTDDIKFGGRGISTTDKVKAYKEPLNNKPYNINIFVPKYSAIILKKM